MDELKKLTCSRHGYKSHRSKVLSNAEEVLDHFSEVKRDTPNSTVSSSDTVFFTEYLKPLKLKIGISTELDDKYCRRWMTKGDWKLQCLIQQTCKRAM